MVYLHSSISVCNSVDPMIMSHFSPKSRNTRNKSSSSPTCSKFPVCDGSQSAAIDVVILIAVITACGFLFFPYVKLITLKSIEVFSDLSLLVKQEILQNPIVDAANRIVKALGKLLSLIFSLRLRNASRAPATRGECLSCLVFITVNWKLS
ncbi:putative ribosomal protein L34Ae [Arabidopsis thaliana]